VIISAFEFGRIHIANDVYTSDLWIIDGALQKRDKSYAKQKYGTSHKIPCKEMKQVVTENTRRVIIGTGNSGLVSLTQKAMDFLKDQGIELLVQKTGDLAANRIEIQSHDSGILHLTC
jgi:hypothetical protein